MEDAWIRLWLVGFIFEELANRAVRYIFYIW